MAKVFNRTAGFLAANFNLGRHGGKPGSVAQAVHDGDTVNVSTADNLGCRFLGIDTPEVSYKAPGSENRFVSPDAPELAALLADPFGPAYGEISGLSRALRDRLSARANADAGANHKRLAEAAHRALEGLMRSDLAEFGIAETEFVLFAAFAYEALDGYGRLLCYLHPSQPQTPAGQRKASYNERMLATGFSAPYFIFPNVDPFRARGSPLAAAMAAISPLNILRQAPSLRRARDKAKDARASGLGIYAAADSLIFDAFELRFLADRRPPNRWIINLASDDRVLHHPQTYLDIPHAEDRLWVPEEFVPLFESAGWLRGASPHDLIV